MTGNSRFLMATALVACVLLCTVAPAAAGPLEAARAAEAKEDWRAAADAYALALEKAPADRDAALGLTRTAVKAGAVELYTFAEDALLSLREKNARDWDVHVALGDISKALSASKNDTLAKKSYDTQAVDSYEAVLKAQPANDVAAAGLAEVFFQSGQFQRAVEAVDAFLAKSPKAPAKALFWKGQALYFQAQDGFRAAGNAFPLSQEVAGLFRKAQGAFRGATAGDPQDYTAWMQLAYASAWLSESEAALEGYRRALELDPENAFPFRGIQELLKSDPAALEAELRSLVTKHPKHPRALFELGRNRLAAQDYRTALDLFERHVKVAKTATGGFYWLGKAAEGAGDEARAVTAFHEALKSNPDDVYAAWELDVRIQKSGSMQRAQQSVAEAEKIIEQYQPLLASAPRNATVRNNLAFTLREAYVAHQGSKPWLPILEASTKYYVEASAILGEWTMEKERTLDWAQRYAQAQIISDTGLMFQFYEPTRDLDKAIEYYERALEYTEDGYRDAFNNYSQILAQQERWEDLYELAKACAEGIRTEQGNPDTVTRNRAKAIAQKLVADGKVER